MVDLGDLIPNEYVVVEIDEQMLRRFAPQLLTEGGGWQSAPQQGWSYRLDPARPEMKQRRHVHVARTEHTRAKNKQVAWNNDGTRHDKKSFDANLKGIRTAREIARVVLKLPPHIALERLDERPGDRELLTEALREFDVDVARATIIAVCERKEGIWDKYL